MRPGWAAASVRSRALARRRYGAAAAGTLAAEPSLERALGRLVRSPYGHDVRPGQPLVPAQHAVAATTLWHLRVLAGWSPWDGVRLLRAVAAGFEVANADAALQGPRAREGTLPAFELGALGTLDRRLTPESPPEVVRAALAGSSWGDPGAASAFAVGLHLRLVWARRCAAELPAAWVPGAIALLVARERLLAGRILPPPTRRLARPFVGEQALAAGSLEELVAGLPAPAAWPFAECEEASSLWRAERAWWRRVEEDGFRALRAGRLDRSALVGACAVLAVDAWRVRAALGAAARGGMPTGDFDAVA